jgi:hypothetical protein
MGEDGKKKDGKGGGKKKRKGKEPENGKRSEMQILFSFSLLVDTGGFIGGGRDCAILHDEGLLFIYYPFFPERFQREPMGREHAFSESSPIPEVLRSQRLPVAFPLVNKLFLQLRQHYMNIVAQKTNGATAMKP